MPRRLWNAWVVPTSPNCLQDGHLDFRDPRISAGIHFTDLFLDIYSRRRLFCQHLVLILFWECECRVLWSLPSTHHVTVSDPLKGILYRSRKHQRYFIRNATIDFKTSQDVLKTTPRRLEDVTMTFEDVLKTFSRRLKTIRGIQWSQDVLKRHWHDLRRGPRRLETSWRRQWEWVIKYHRPQVDILDVFDSLAGSVVRITSFLWCCLSFTKLLYILLIGWLWSFI